MKMPWSAQSLPPQIRRFRIWLIGFALVAASVLFGALHPSSQAQVGSGATKATAASFHPTKEQWASLKVAPVQLLTFRSILVSDGNIAFNDDRLTAVFSPYSGRVTRLIAKLGDTVKQGAPLMAVEASEFVQGQSDLAAARAALDTAQAQLTLAEASEKR